MEDYITRKEHEAFKELMESENKRLAEEDNRQNKRIESLEESMQKVTDMIASLTSSAISPLAASTERISANMENILVVQAEQKNEIQKLTARDGENWRKVVDWVGGAVIGGIVCYLLLKIGIGG